MREISDRIGAPLDPRNLSEPDKVILPYEIEDNALEMTMREVAGYIAAMHGGNWTITDSGYLYLAPLGVASQSDADIGAYNTESLSVFDPLEPFSGVRFVWNGDEWDASVPEMGESARPVKNGDEIGFAGDESGRVLEIKIAFGQRAIQNPAHLWDTGAQNILNIISGGVYAPFDTANAVINPAYEIGDAVTIPDGVTIICSMSGELDGLCSVDVSAPPDEAINTAYPANWLGLQGKSSDSLTPEEIEQTVSDAWDAVF